MMDSHTVTGKTVYYNYDVVGNLETIKDENDKKICSYNYHK